MTTTKKALSFRLSDKAIEKLRLLSAKHQGNKTKTLEEALDIAFYVEKGGEKQRVDLIEEKRWLLRLGAIQKGVKKAV